MRDKERIFFMGVCVVSLVNLMINREWTTALAFVVSFAVLAAFVSEEKQNSKLHDKVDELITRITDARKTSREHCELLDDKIEKLNKQISQIESLAAKANMGQAFAFQRTGK